MLVSRRRMAPTWVSMAALIFGCDGSAGQRQLYGARSTSALNGASFLRKSCSSLSFMAALRVGTVLVLMQGRTCCLALVSHFPTCAPARFLSGATLATATLLPPAKPKIWPPWGRMGMWMAPHG